MSRRRIRIGIASAAVAAASSGVVLAFPAHAGDTRVCTAKTGPSACVVVDTFPTWDAVTVAEGTAPRYTDATGVEIGCYPAHVYAITAVKGSGHSVNIPVPGFAC